VKIAIIGGGSIGQRHTRNLRSLGLENISIRVFEPNNDRAGYVQEKLGVQVTTSYKDMLDNDFDVAFVTNPTRYHVETALDFASRGIDLFIEKPLSDVIDDNLHKLLKVVKEKKLITMVGCNTRFYPALQYIKDVLKNESLGALYSARIQFGHYLPNWHPWEDYRQGYSANRSLGGGILLDAVHELDYARWLFGSPMGIPHVMGGKLSNLEIDTEDLVSILYSFENCPVVHIHFDYLQRYYNRSCQIIGEYGTISWDYRDHHVEWYDARDDVWHKYLVEEGVNEMYVRELEHFFECVKYRKQSCQTVEETLEVQQMVESIRKHLGGS